MLTARSDRFQIPEAQHQFPGGGIGTGLGFGFGIPAFGSSGFAGGTLGSPAAGAIGPVLTLESAFGVGFTSQDIADQIAQAEQEGTLTGGAVIDIVTGPVGQLVINLVSGLFEILDPESGAKLAGGVTAEAALVALQAGGGTAGGGAVSEPPIFPPTLGAVTTPPFVAPPPPPDRGLASPENLRAFFALVADMFTRGDDPLGTPPRRDPLPAGVIPRELIEQIFLPGTFPPIPNVPGGGARVIPGGTVNVPVVLGSTGDPTGIRRPTFPSEENLSRAQQIGQIIRNILALRKARQNADKQRRAFEQFLANRLEILRGQAMPFGQAGFVAGPIGGGAISALADLAIAAGGSFLADRFGGGTSLQQFPVLPQATGLPGIPGLQGGPAFGGGACPSLFRSGGSVLRMSPVPWFPVQAPTGKWFFFGHLGTPTFSKLKGRRRHHHHARKR